MVATLRLSEQQDRIEELLGQGAFDGTQATSLAVVGVLGKFAKKVLAKIEKGQELTDADMVRLNAALDTAKYAYAHDGNMTRYRFDKCRKAQEKSFAVTAEMEKGVAALALEAVDEEHTLAAVTALSSMNNLMTRIEEAAQVLTDEAENSQPSSGGTTDDLIAGLKADLEPVKPQPEEKPESSEDYVSRILGDLDPLAQKTPSTSETTRRPVLDENQQRIAQGEVSHVSFMTRAKNVLGFFSSLVPSGRIIGRGLATSVIAMLMLGSVTGSTSTGSLLVDMDNDRAAAIDTTASVMDNFLQPIITNFEDGEWAEVSEEMVTAAVDIDAPADDVLEVVTTDENTGVAEESPAADEGSFRTPVKAVEISSDGFNSDSDTGFTMGQSIANPYGLQPSSLVEAGIVPAAAESETAVFDPALVPDGTIVTDTVEFDLSAVPNGALSGFDLAHVLVSEEIKVASVDFDLALVPDGTIVTDTVEFDLAAVPNGALPDFNLADVPVSEERVKLASVDFDPALVPDGTIVPVPMARPDRVSEQQQQMVDTHERYADLDSDGVSPYQSKAQSLITAEVMTLDNAGDSITKLFADAGEAVPSSIEKQLNLAEKETNNDNYVAWRTQESLATVISSAKRTFDNDSDRVNAFNTVVQGLETIAEANVGSASKRAAQDLESIDWIKGRMGVKGLVNG